MSEIQSLFDAAETAHATQNNKRAIQILEKLLHYHPHHPKALYKVAVIHWTGSDDFLATRYCSFAARICALHIEYETKNGTYEEKTRSRGYSYEYWRYIFIGLIADFALQYKAAKDNYQAAIDLVSQKKAPDSGYEAYLNLGIVYMNNEEYEEAIDLFQKANDVENSAYYRSTCLNNIGQVYGTIQI
jgi:tetratricopeptide (TPR) repeat protein